MCTSWSRFGTAGKSVSKYQHSHIGSDLGFEPLTSEVGGECARHYTSEPRRMAFDILNLWLEVVKLIMLVYPFGLPYTLLCVLLLWHGDSIHTSSWLKTKVPW